MTSNFQTILPAVIKKNESDLLAEWQKEQEAVIGRQANMKEGELHEQCKTFLNLLQEATQTGHLNDITGAAWSEMRDFLTTISQSRALQGMSASETATFVFSFKRPLFNRLQKELNGDPGKFADEVWLSGELLDKLGLITTESYIKSRNEIVVRQQQDLLELSTPVVSLWDGILALPLIGTLDSSRTQVVMESLLQKIVETGFEIAIIDITGVPTVDTLVAQHLIKTVTAAKLMGANCIISGIRPQIAQTIVHLGVDLGDIVTKANLKDALALALKHAGLTVTREKVKTMADRLPKEA